MSVGLISGPGESPALEGGRRSPHHTLRRGAAAGLDAHGAGAPHPLAQDLREKPAGFRAEASAWAAGPPTPASALWCHVALPFVGWGS